MNQTFYKSLTPALLGAVAVATVANINPANAATIGAGNIDLVPLVSPGNNQIVNFLNNAVDYNADGSDFQPGEDPNEVPYDGGTFLINNAEGGFADLGFEDKLVRVVDLYTPSSAIPGGSFLNGVEYDLVDIFTNEPLPGLETVDGMTGLPIFYYDLDEDGDFSDDAVYYATSFVREAEPAALGGFTLELEFDGFMYSPDGTFDKTNIPITLETATSLQNPDSLPAIDGPAPLALANAEESNIVIEQNSGTTVPEASNIFAILSLGALALTMKLKKIKVA